MSTPPGDGDEPVVGSPGWLQRVFDTEARDDIFTGATPTPGTEQTRQLDPDAAVGWLRRYQATFTLAKTRPGYLNPATAPAYRLLQTDAATMIDLATQTGKADTAGFKQEQQWRRLQLDQIDSEPPTGRLGSR